MRLPRMKTRRWMVAVGLLAVLIAIVKRVNDPMATFRRRTGLGGAVTARVLITRYGTGFHGSEFAVVFDADRKSVVNWASEPAPSGWRSWYAGAPRWVAGRCFLSREVFTEIPIGRPDSPAICFTFRDSPVYDDECDLIVLDRSIGRVWFLSWGY
jgi:hypothetical protein